MDEVIGWRRRLVQEGRVRLLELTHVVDSRSSHSRRIQTAYSLQLAAPAARYSACRERESSGMRCSIEEVAREEGQRERA